MSEKKSWGKRGKWKPDENYVPGIDRASQKLVELMEKGVPLWTRRWMLCSAGISAATGKPYEGFAAFLAGAAREEFGWKSNVFMTFDAARKKGGNVKRGEKSHVYVRKWIRLEPKPPKAGEEGQDAALSPRRRGFMKFDALYNYDQVEGVDPKMLPVDPYPKLNEHEAGDGHRMAEDVVQAAIKLLGITNVRHGSNVAAYIPMNHSLTLPDKGQFDTLSDYYKTVFHELLHATGHKSATGRIETYKDNIFDMNSEARKEEEALVEIGAFSLVGTLGISTPELENNCAAYVRHWAPTFKNDLPLMRRLMDRSSKATLHLLGIAPEVRAKRRKLEREGVIAPLPPVLAELDAQREKAAGMAVAREESQEEPGEEQEEGVPEVEALSPLSASESRNRAGQAMAPEHPLEPSVAPVL